MFDFKELLKRYQSDPEFHHVVRTMEEWVRQSGVTHLELRQAAFFAAMKFQLENPGPFEIDGQKLEYVGPKMSLDR